MKRAARLDAASAASSATGRDMRCDAGGAHAPTNGSESSEGIHVSPDSRAQTHCSLEYSTYRRRLKYQHLLNVRTGYHKYAASASPSHPQHSSTVSVQACVSV
eukprot:1594851-Pleurochrysis_carterae.AAC.1